MLDVLWTGIATGCLYALVAVGVNLVFLPTRTFNFAQAQFVTLGALIAYTAVVTLGLPWIVGLLAAAGIPAVLALIEERVVLRVGERRGASPHLLLVATLGVGIALQGAASSLWGEDPVRVPFVGANDTFSIGSVQMQPSQLTIVVVALAVTAAYELYVRRTRSGLRYQAVAEDRVAVELLGVPSQRVIGGAFVVAGALGGAVGILAAPQTFAYPELGSALLVSSFAALAIGGFGSQLGALIGGLVLGITETQAAYHLEGSYSTVVAFVLLLAVLTVRPGGLLGQRGRRVI